MILYSEVDYLLTDYPWFILLALCVVIILILLIGTHLFFCFTQHRTKFIKAPEGVRLHWSANTKYISVLFDPGLPSSYIQIYKAVAEEINEIIGRHLLDPVGISSPLDNYYTNVALVPNGHIYITCAYTGKTLGNDTRSFQTGQKLLRNFRYFEDGKIEACYLELSNALRRPQLINAMRHALGHALGLKHTDDVWSAMYAHTGGGVCSFRSRDKKALKAQYGKN